MGVSTLTPREHGLKLLDSQREFHAPITATIPGLLQSSRPTNVARLIITFIVDAIKRTSGLSKVWKTRHVFQERREAGTARLPLRTDFNPSATVSVVIPIPRVVASVPDVLPQVIKGVPAQAVGGRSHNRRLTSETAATMYSLPIVSQIAGHHDKDRSAVANALEGPLPIRISARFALHDQASVALTKEHS